DRAVRLWDIATAAELRRFEGHSRGVEAVAFSPDGKTLAAGSYDYTVRLWDVATAAELSRFEGHSAVVRAVAFSPDGKTLASGSHDGTVRLWSQGKGTDYPASQVFLSGQRGTWIGCRADGKCLRHDDGTLLIRKNDGGRLEPLAPPPAATPELELVPVPTTLETTDGSATPFTLKVRNNGTGRAFWINVRRAARSESDPLVFHPPPTQVVLDSGDEAELACRVSTHSAYESPRGQSVFLGLEVTSAHSEPLVVEPILIHGKTPTLDWDEARWWQDGEQFTLVISLTNTGEQDLSSADFWPVLSNSETPLGTYRRITLAGEKVTMSFSVSETFERIKDSRVTLAVRKLQHPIHEWIFADKTVLPPRTQ
ncbi:MAG: WD40 repeat domain-containing protein, partial [bacterium]|nr:WD40 repeat domain-containing protein [bacterium]